MDAGLIGIRRCDSHLDDHRLVPAPGHMEGEGFGPSPRGLKFVIRKWFFFIDFQWFSKDFEGFDKARKGLKPYQRDFDEGEKGKT